MSYLDDKVNDLYVVDGFFVGDRDEDEDEDEYYTPFLTSTLFTKMLDRIERRNHCHNTSGPLPASPPVSKATWKAARPRRSPVWESIH